MNEPRLHVSERMQSLMSYTKFDGPAPRVLVLRSQYWLDGACISAAERMGWEVATAHVLMEGRMERDLIETLLRKLTGVPPGLHSEY